MDKILIVLGHIERRRAQFWTWVNSANLAMVTRMLGLLQSTTFPASPPPYSFYSHFHLVTQDEFCKVSWEDTEKKSNSVIVNVLKITETCRVPHDTVSYDRLMYTVQCTYICICVREFLSLRLGYTNLAASGSGEKQNRGCIRAKTEKSEL